MTHTRATSVDKIYYFQRHTIIPGNVMEHERHDSERFPRYRGATRACGPGWWGPTMPLPRFLLLVARISALMICEYFLSYDDNTFFDRSLLQIHVSFLRTSHVRFSAEFKGHFLERANAIVVLSLSSCLPCFSTDARTNNATTDNNFLSCVRTKSEIQVS